MTSIPIRNIPAPFLHPLAALQEVQVKGKDKPELVMNLWGAASTFVWLASTEIGNIEAVNNFLAIASESRVVTLKGATVLLARCREGDVIAIRQAIAIIQGSLNEKIQEAVK